jgi:hypothetical protein
MSVLSRTACDMYVNCLISCGTVPAAACKSTIQLYYFQVLITDPHCPHPPSCSQSTSPGRGSSSRMACARCRIVYDKSSFSSTAGPSSGIFSLRTPALSQSCSRSTVSFEFSLRRKRCVVFTTTKSKNDSYWQYCK